MTTTKSSRLYSFVKSIFKGQGKEISDGAITIEMDVNPRFLVVRLYEDEDKDTVDVTINNVKMGIFREYTKQGYKYEFEQRYRKGIRNGRTSAEQFMEDTCTFYRDTIHLLKAYG
ncbi:MAG: hypothetical protein HDS62_00920 [Bacteroidales bacterium]|nr:hypothetical protein [Bacteroidales bacterium]